MGCKGWGDHRDSHVVSVQVTARFTNYYRDKLLRFGQAVTIAVGHDRDCYVQFGYSCKQLYHVEKISKIIIGPKELINHLKEASGKQRLFRK